ncbi:MAG: TIGR03435 family protein, partial [Bryobacteraceae bacterium]
GHIRTERELCCDDIAVSAGSGALTYARALAELESFRPAHFNTAIAANGGSLTYRIGRLLGQSPAASRTLSGPGVAMTAALLSATACALVAQSAATPKFEVASIKPSPPGEPPSMRVSPGGRLTVTNETLKYLVQFAYNVQDYQISGGPGWIDSAGYDILATPERAANPNPDNIGYFRRLLQGLLAERFRLTLQHTRQDLPEYALVVGPRGPKLKEREKWKDATDMRLSGGKGLMIGQQVTMGLVAQNLSARVGRPVEDATGLKGYYDFRLEWTPDETDGAPTPSDQTGPSLFTAIREQLGLKLESVKGPVEVLVIDHVERPTEN